MEPVSAEQARKQAAEARRQKILARQKDRLSSITGVYSKPEGSSDNNPDQSPAAEAAPAATTGRASAVDVVQRQVLDNQQLELQQQQEQAALMAALGDSLQRALAASQAVEAGSQQQELLTSPAQAAGASSIASSDTQQLHSSLLQRPQPQQQSASLLLQLGPLLLVAVRRTQLVRMLVAVLMAYAALSGRIPPGVPPVLVVVMSDLCFLASVMVLMHTQVLSGWLSAVQQGDEVKMPWRLRSFDLLSLVPGLRELMGALSGYRQLASALYDDVAVYIVTLVVLVVTGAVELAPWTAEEVQ